MGRSSRFYSPHKIGSTGTRITGGEYKKQPWSVLPSQFAAFIANEIEPCRLLEVGCGNGRDSLFFSSAGFDVVAADYSAAAVELSRTRSEESGIKLEVVQLNVYNWSQVIRFIGQSSAAFDAVYAPFFLHAVSQRLENAISGGLAPTSSNREANAV
jgi:2-polyprenyl-3-methyl-5-hydroxy-6-metoxy-1,4-benzoquinol methylase